MPPDENRQRYWRRNLRVIVVLLLAWFLATFGVAYFARALSFSFFGWPFSVWMGGQGALVIYCVLVWIYARHMNRLDREHGLAERE